MLSMPVLALHSPPFATYDLELTPPVSSVITCWECDWRWFSRGALCRFFAADVAAGLYHTSAYYLAHTLAGAALLGLLSRV